MAEGETGKPWTDTEIAVAIDAYFRMLAWHLDGRDFVKADVRHDVMELLPARSGKSIDLKWCNVSAVLNESELSVAHRVQTVVACSGAFANCRRGLA